MAKSSRNRAMSLKKALRKRRISNTIYYFPYYNNLHQYSKNKIHCSCGYCVSKSKNKGKKRHLHANYAPSVNWSISDKKKIMSLDKSLNSYLSKYVPVAYLVKHQTVKIWLLLVRTQSGTPRDELF